MAVTQHLQYLSILIMFSTFLGFSQNRIDISNIINKVDPGKSLIEMPLFNAKKETIYGVDMIVYECLQDTYSGREHVQKNEIYLFDIPVKTIVFFVLEDNLDEIQYLEMKVLPSRANEKKLLEKFQEILGEKYELGDSSVSYSKEYQFTIEKGTCGFQYHPIKTGREELIVAYMSDKLVKLSTSEKEKN